MIEVGYGGSSGSGDVLELAGNVGGIGDECRAETADEFFVGVEVD